MIKFSRFLIMSLSLVFLVCLVPLSAKPVVEVDSMNFNVGSILEGTKDKVVHKFTLKNTGDEVLKINKVKPG